MSDIADVTEPSEVWDEGPLSGMFATRQPLSVSVVIPVKDDAENLRRCLTALGTQTVAPFEVIVVDNGSTDDSAAVATELGATVVTHEGGGIPATSAAGYDAATGQLIARLDADCVPPADWVQTIDEYFGDHTGVSALTGSAYFTDGPKWLRRIGADLYLGAYFLALAPALGHPPIFGSNCGIRRSAWLEVSDLVHRDDELVHDDLDLAYHLGPVRRIAYSHSLRMGISSRPFADASAFALRLKRGWHSVVLHWPVDLPWRRWARRYSGE